MFWIILATALICIAGTVHAQASYDPSGYINALYATSDAVNFDNWSAGNGAYTHLADLCSQIESNYPSLATSAQLCVRGADLVVQGGVCDGNCHTDYNRTHYGPIVDAGIADINQASLTLAN